jgi:PHP family Zn ribbon phosphoesterase
MHLLPLSEIIATVLGVDSPSTQQVWNIYNKLVEKFGDEYTVLIDTPQGYTRSGCGREEC